MNTDPAGAPPRTDLPFLRHRGSRPRVPAPGTSAAAPPSPLSDFVHGHGPRATHAASPPPGATTSPSVAAAVGRKAPEPPRPAPAPTGGSSLDLSGAAPAPAPVSASGSSLDLSAGPAAAAQGPKAARPEPPRIPVRDRPRVVAGRQRILDITSPTVVLTRVQSGIGQLEIEAACSDEVGDLRLGAAYELTSGTTSTVQLAGGNRFAPSSRSPVVVAGRDEYENLRIDLRRNRELRRLAVYAFSESRAELAWGGTLVVTTFGRGRIELPLETLYAGRTAVLLSIYNLEGEFVVRAEMETIDGDIREAARAYGYDRITWRDARSPVE